MAAGEERPWTADTSHKEADMADDRDDKEKEESTSTKGGPEGGEINHPSPVATWRRRVPPSAPTPTDT